MYKLITVMLTLTAGLVLGWFAHELRAPAPVQQAVPGTAPVAPLPAAGLAATVSGQDSGGRVDSVRQLLQHHAYPEAIARYESFQEQADKDGMQQVRAAILRHAQELLKNRNFTAAGRLLQRFLLVAYRDVDARLLLAEAYYGQQDYLVTIEQLYEARGHAYRPAMLAQITGRIRSVVNQQAELYRQNSDSRGLLELFQQVTQLEPDHAAYFVELAVAQLALDDRGAAQASLALVMHDPDVGEQAQALLTKLQQTATFVHESESAAAVTAVAGIPLTRRGQHFLVDVTPGTTGTLQLLIDTGASMTIVTPGALQQQDVRYRDTGRYQVFNTANGSVRAPVYILESLSVGDWYVEQIEIGVLDLHGQSGFDGLLGMNFLKHFRFFIDQNKSMLRLSLN
jgi:clan AA aspartic protease (TIGR02281 family)